MELRRAAATRAFFLGNLRRRHGPTTVAAVSPPNPPIPRTRNWRLNHVCRQPELLELFEALGPPSSPDQEDSPCRPIRRTHRMPRQPSPSQFSLRSRALQSSWSPL